MSTRSMFRAAIAIAIAAWLAGCGSGGGGSTSNSPTSSALTGSVLYSFGTTGSTDGRYPNAGLIQGSDGNFYGTTPNGGTGSMGTVFRVTPAGVEAVLYSFGPPSGKDAVNPFAALVQANDGNFYGVTVGGGANNTGTVFRVSTAGIESVLYSFGLASGSDGQAPTGSLIQASDGNLYGVTAAGGSNGTGTVFRITLAGQESVLYSFGPTSSSDARAPGTALVQAADGNLYGVTYSGGASNGGTVFRMTLAGQESVLYSFGPPSGPDGNGPSSRLFQGSDGQLYGTTGGGGANQSGTIFKVSTAGAESVLYSFPTAGSTNPWHPIGLIQAADGRLFATTDSGGANFAGAVLALSPSGTQSVYSFGASASDGVIPRDSVIQGSDHHFYGTTSIGGANQTGTVFRID